MLKQIQSEQKEWQERNFGKSNYMDNMLGIVEEVGELSHALLKQRQNIRNIQEHDIKDAVGDILIYLLGFCNQMGYNLEQILDETWCEVKKRDWVKFPENGITK